MLANLNLSVLFALIITVAMIAVASYIVLQHDSKHSQFEEWVDFSFTADSLRRAIDYYRFMAVSMLFTYVLFTTSCVWLQADGYQIFAEGGKPLHVSPIGVALFTLDLTLRGGFFDFMQHFDLSLSQHHMNRQLRWFVWYAFVYRMFYGFTMFKILFSFLWIYGKIRINRQAREAEATQPRLFK